MPNDFNMPKSPFSTAINTDRKCSKSDLKNDKSKKSFLVNNQKKGDGNLGLAETKHLPLISLTPRTGKTSNLTSSNAELRQNLQWFVIRSRQLPPFQRRPMVLAHREPCCRTIFPSNLVRGRQSNFARRTLFPQPVVVLLGKSCVGGRKTRINCNWIMLENLGIFNERASDINGNRNRKAARRSKQKFFFHCF